MITMLLLKKIQFPLSLLYNFAARIWEIVMANTIICSWNRANILPLTANNLDSTPEKSELEIVNLIEQLPIDDSLHKNLSK